MTQLAKNPPAMWETWVQSLGWEDALEKVKATHSSILAWRIPWTTVQWGRKESDTTEQFSLSSFLVETAEGYSIFLFTVKVAQGRTN